MSFVASGPCFWENCFKLLALAVGIMCLKITCWKSSLLKKEKAHRIWPWKSPESCEILELLYSIVWILQKFSSVALTLHFT